MTADKKTAIIGIAGPKRVGKTFLADYLAHTTFPEECGLYGTVTSFATPVKEAALSLGWNGRKDEDGRRLLQLLGTEIGRNLISPDIWVLKWADKVMYNHKGMDIILVDDVRFDNEADIIRKVARMTEAVPVVMELTGRTQYTGDHESECGLSRDQIDFRVDCSGWKGEEGTRDWARAFAATIVPRKE